MDKQKFVDVLKKAGYSSAVIEDNKPTVTFVGVDKATLKRAYINIGLIAKKVGYKHSWGVKNLEEEHAGQ